MRVLVIPEDFRNDQHVLKPVIEALVKAVGRPSRVKVCTDPLLGGFGEALRSDRIREILVAYRYKYDLFILCVDRDGQEGRQQQLSRIEQDSAEVLGPGKVLLAVAACQVLETWVLAGLRDLQAEWTWTEIREELNAKQLYFEAHAKRRGIENTSAGGRSVLGQEAARNFDRICQLCPEVAELRDRIRSRLTSRP